MKHRNVIIILAICLAVSVGLNLGIVGMAAFRFGFKRGMDPGPPRQPGIVGRLELSPEQIAELGQTRRELSEEMRPLREALGEKRREALRLLAEEELDSAGREKLFTEIARMQVELEMMTFDKFYEAKEILRPEQQELFMHMMQQEFQHRGPFMPGEGHHGPGPKEPGDKPPRNRRSK